MDANELFYSFNTAMTTEEVADLCRQILKAEDECALTIIYAKTAGWWLDSVAEPCQAILDASGNHAYAIALAKTADWWDDSVAEPCQAILDAPGDRAMVIAHAKSEGWWDDSVAEPCQAILNAPGNRAYAIALAKNAGWWLDSIAEPCQAILDAPGDRAYAIALAKSAGWWLDSVAEPCQAIIDSPGDRAYAIYFAKSEGWWLDSVAEPCQAILNAPGNRAYAITLAKNAGWWLNPGVIKASFVENSMLHDEHQRIAIFNQMVGDQMKLNRSFKITLPYHSFGSRWENVKFIIDAGYDIHPDALLETWVVKLPDHSKSMSPDNTDLYHVMSAEQVAAKMPSIRSRRINLFMQKVGMEINKTEPYPFLIKLDFNVFGHNIDDIDFIQAAGYKITKYEHDQYWDIQL